MTIALIGFLHETNTFCPTRTEYAAFDTSSPAGKHLVGADVVQLRGTNSGIGGAWATLEQAGLSCTPISWCEAEPGGVVADDAFERIMATIETGLRRLAQVSGVFLELHGAMVTESHADAELEILRRICQIVPKTAPIVAALDLHGNISPEFLATVDGLSAYRTYPHVDIAATGSRCASQLIALLRGGSRPARVHRPLPFFIPMHEQCTLEEPCKALYAMLDEMEQEARSNALALSLFTGFYLADVYWAGPAVVAFANDKATADRAAARLEAFLQSQCCQFSKPVYRAEEIAARLRHHSGAPIALAEIQDNPGGGGSGDVMDFLAALLAAGVSGIAASAIHDPGTVARLAEVAPGTRVSLNLGGRGGRGSGLTGEFTLLGHYTGCFELTGPMSTGMTIDLGPTVKLGIGGAEIVVASNRVQNLDTGFFTAADIDPRSKRILLLKSAVHYRAAYADLCADMLCVDTPGWVARCPSGLEYEHLRGGMAMHPSLWGANIGN